MRLPGDALVFGDGGRQRLPIGRGQELPAGLDDLALARWELEAVRANVFVEDKKPVGRERLGDLREYVFQRRKVMHRSVAEDEVVMRGGQGQRIHVGDGVVDVRVAFCFSPRLRFGDAAGGYIHRVAGGKRAQARQPALQRALAAAQAQAARQRQSAGEVVY